jgi:transposase
VLVIGADSHKRTHTMVAVDQVGRWLGERTVKATSDGHLELLEWSAQWPQVMFALEDCRHLTRRLEADLLAAGQRVVRVPTRLMAAARRAGRQPGKSDPIDAEAVALAALRHPDLPVAELDGPTREVKLLVDYRRDLVRQRTRGLTGCAGTCTSWIPSSTRLRGAWTAAASWTGSVSGSPSCQQSLDRPGR